MSMIPRSPLAERRQALLRRIGMLASALMVLLVMSIFAFVVRSERAHDEVSCPFARVSERAFAGARVIEESRSCVPEAEERRWLVQRGTSGGVEFGRKRLPRARFQSDRTQWKLSEDKAHRLILQIEVDGQPFSEFHEADLPQP